MDKTVYYEKIDCFSFYGERRREGTSQSRKRYASAYEDCQLKIRTP
jgi:hypothetical protein